MARIYKPAGPSDNKAASPGKEKKAGKPPVAATGKGEGKGAPPIPGGGEGGQERPESAE